MKLKLEDNTLWPDPTSATFHTIVRGLRHSPESITKNQMMYAAGVMDAYESLALNPYFKSKLPMIRRAIKCLRNARN